MNTPQDRAVSSPVVMKFPHSSSGWVSVRHNKASQQQMMHYSKKCYGELEAGGGGWRCVMCLEAHHFFPFYNLFRQLRSLQALLFQCCCAIPMICSSSLAALLAELSLLSDQQSAWPIKPSSLTADNCSEKRVFAKPVTLSFPGCF